MATTLSDIIGSQSFSEYVLNATAERSALVQSGVVVPDPSLTAFINGYGASTVERFFDELSGDSNVSDDTANEATPAAITGGGQIVPRLIRNKGWAVRGIVQDKEADPLKVVGDKVADYRIREFQKAVIAGVTGVFADNAAAPAGSEHVQDDMTHDISGVSYVAGTTDFSYDAFLDARVTMGDNFGSISAVAMHSVVATRAAKANFISEFRPTDSDTIVRRLGIDGPVVIIDDAMPASGGVYETWLFGAGALPYAMADSKTMPYSLEWKNAAGNGGGEQQMWIRWDMCFAPVGTSYVGATTQGGPANSVLDDAASWQRVYPDRRQIPIARLITRES